MPSDVAEPDIVPDEAEGLRQQIRALMAAEKLTMADCSKQAGIPYSTFAAWQKGEYAGSDARVTDLVQRWLDSRETKVRTQALAPRAPAFVSTPTSEHFLAALEHAQHLAQLVTITGPPGIGKTSACKAYQARAGKTVHMITGEPTMTTPRSLLDELADAIGAPARGLSSLQLSRSIARRMRGTGALIIIDEAQHLTSQVLDQMRTLYDQAEIGIALVGNATVFARLEGGSRAAHYAQLYSRIGMRVSRARSTRKDVDVLLDAWSLQDKPARDLMHAIASKPGALRNVTTVMRVAHMTASAEGADAVGVRHVKLAWETLGSSDASATGAA